MPLAAGAMDSESHAISATSSSISLWNAASGPVAPHVKGPCAATSTAGITLDASEGTGGNRDFILRYRLDGARIQSGLLLFEGEKENFFLLMMEPPKRVTRAVWL